MINYIIRIERLIPLLVVLVSYWRFNLSWILFLIGILLPDLSMVGYTINNRAGAVIYNIFHTYIISLIPVCLGFFLSHTTLLTIGLIWTAHISIDRIFGYGLKYKNGFKFTHLK